MTLDVRTIGIFSIITPCVLGLIMVIHLRERKVYGGFKHWILANFGLSFGYWLVTMSTLPGFLSSVVGNGLIIYCMILIYEGVEQFYGRPGFSRFNYALLGVSTLLLAYFTYVQPHDHGRIFVSSLAVFILIFRTGRRHLLLSIPELAGTSRAAGYVFFVTALFPAARAVSALFTSGPFDPISHILSNWFSVVFIVSIVTWTFYFFFLTSARLELDLERARDELELIARTDPLTNLYNRRHFDECAGIEFQRAKRSGHAISFLLIDIDGFKKINDTNGHEVGDIVLLSLSEILQSELRPFDMVARYGGDEFIIMLMDTNREQAYAIAERIRTRVMETKFDFDSHMFNITLSTGITTVYATDQDLRLTLKRGDTALYHAKQQGKNCVIIA